MKTRIYFSIPVKPHFKIDSKQLIKIKLYSPQIRSKFISVSQYANPFFFNSALRGQVLQANERLRTLVPYSLLFIFTDIFIPNLWMLGDVSFQQLPAFAVIEFDDFDAVLAQPVQSA